MRRISPAAVGLAALTLGTPVALAQSVAPGYTLELEHFGSAPSTSGANDAIEAPGQDVPGNSVQTHVPSLSTQGRGGAHQRPGSIPLPQP